MIARSFAERLSARQAETASLVCIGLDPDLQRLPPHLASEKTAAQAVIAFNRAIIETTADAAAAYKLNLAFFEALGAESWNVLQETLNAIPEAVPVIADGKRGDIGNSARFYAHTCFDLLGFDACTVSGYMGKDSVAPFLDHPGRGVFLLARTSNPGGSDFQKIEYQGRPLYEHVVRTALAWEEPGNDGTKGSLGFVAGASDIEALRRIRALAPGSPLLIPGVGAQGGHSSKVLEAVREGSGPVLVNSSRAILYASDGRDFATAARKAAEALRMSLTPTLS